MHLVVPQPKTQALLLLRDGLRDGRARPRAHDAAGHGAVVAEREHFFEHKDLARVG